MGACKEEGSVETAAGEMAEVVRAGRADAVGQEVERGLEVEEVVMVAD